jgi:ribosomal protein S19
MKRSRWKGVFALLNSQITNSKILHIWDRRQTIPCSKKIGYSLVYNGKIFKKIFLKKEKFGFKFGEFCFCRKFTKKITLKKNVKKRKSNNKKTK